MALTNAPLMMLHNRYLCCEGSNVFIVVFKIQQYRLEKCV